MSPSRASKVKFVASDPARGGLPVKRKQVQHACSLCRRKKRRCIHALDDSPSTAPQQQHCDSLSAQPLSPTAPSSMTTGAASLVPSHQGRMESTPATLPPESLSQDDAGTSANADVAPQSSRFVGDLNPEGMFLEATRHEAQNEDVGIWLSSSTPAAAGPPSQFITSRPPLAMDQFLLPFVRQHCLSCLPPPDDYTKLEAVYLAKIDPIFPIIPQHALRGHLDMPCNIISRQIVCLAAATDPEMSPHLRLQNKGHQLLSAQDFSHALSSAVRAILETSITTDRVVHIRALVLLSLYTQPTCAEEADLPAQLGGRAIHHIQTLGLHLLRYDAPNCQDLNNLFCVVWALDRINAAVYGRPYLIHERDIGADLDACIRDRPPCFRLFLFIVQWLEQIIELYRPGPSAEASGLKQVTYIDLPMLEAMIVSADALKVPSHLIATLETFFHAVVILSCRLPRPGTPSAASTLPPASASARRSLAADRIAFAVTRDALSPVPLVPYALSLALSVEYRKMRHSRLPMFRTRSMLSFRRNCELLKKFGDYFWSAKVVAGLGERILKEMERAATAMNKEGSPAPQHAEARTGPAAADSVLPEPAAYSLHSMVPTVGFDDGVHVSLIDAVSGQDIFGHIDPSFDLNAVEDALEANLDIGLPLNWGDWDQFKN
ncbi:hypothetical protein CDD82_3475 [Ophiocordyceps australis]|uniref:Xylanolytic transcriptional activator regulatory domain-containing protein n=1 Tax=Ophiocordyceps australis TaxID=1399860 RepID=A0A2C5ZCJ2_9HYPO|nr:hypothetical protein CDD82_3475 [Ophiocordyceps australis]